MSIDLSQFYQVFFDETAEHLGNMEAHLLDLDVNDPDDEELNAIFRAAHSIKGAAGTFGFNDLAEVTHELETLLDRLRKHEIALRSEMIDAFLAAGDVLKAQLAAHRDGDTLGAEDAERICAVLRQLAGNASPAAPGAGPGQNHKIGDYRFELDLTLPPQISRERLIANLRDLGEIELLDDGSDPAHLQLRIDTSVAEGESCLRRN
jgi:two-component system chemotaxis sensor kinase CheA